MIATIVLPEQLKMKVKYEVIAEDVVIQEVYFNEYPVLNLLISLNMLYGVDLTENIFTALMKKHDL